jgi:PAS domain S-box-containing protein
MESQAREVLLKIFVKNVPAGVAMLDRDMRYLQVSDRWCVDYGVDASQVLGRSHYEVFPDMPDGWREIHRRALAGETLRAAEDRWDRKSGTTWVRWEARPWLNVVGEPGGILIFAEDITRRKQADEALSGMSQKLIESQEQERTRIGRELHDDINQRLALLTIELDRLDQSGSINAVHDILQELKRRVIEISTDVQALSHQLHSSKLEYLGLAAAAKSFCREVSEMHHVRIDFTQSEVPRNLPKDVALCLFPVLQEALQNAVKYSGTGRCEVSLCGTSVDIELRIRDFGRGFSVDDAMGTKGLGLVSMRERVNLVKGEIVIKSNPTVGTEIMVHVPASTADCASRVTSGAA